MVGSEGGAFVKEMIHGRDTIGVGHVGVKGSLCLQVTKATVLAKSYWSLRFYSELSTLHSCLQTIVR